MYNFIAIIPEPVYFLGAFSRTVKNPFPGIDRLQPYLQYEARPAPQ